MKVRQFRRSVPIQILIALLVLSWLAVGTTHSSSGTANAPAVETTLTATADTYVMSYPASTNRGDWDNMQAGYLNSFGDVYSTLRSLVQFDLSSIPPCSKISSATLRVYYFLQHYPGVDMTVTAYRVTSPWSEMAANWDNIGEAYGESYGSVLLTSELGYQGWKSMDVTDLVQAWVNGTHSNHGIMLRGDESQPENFKYFRTKESEESGYEAQLVVAYEANTAPVLSNLPDQTLGSGGYANNAIDLWQYANDAEALDSELTFAIDNTPDPGAGVEIDSNRYIDILPASGWTGETDVTIRVTDPCGLSDTDTFKVTRSGGVTEYVVYAPLILRNSPQPYVLDSTTFAPFAGSSSTYLVGRVHNPTARTVGSVRVKASYYDAGGALLQTGEAYVCLANLAPGMGSPFVDISSDFPTSSWSRYDLEVEWSEAGSTPIALNVTGENAFFDSLDRFHVTGTATNSQSRRLERNQACVTMLDASGKTIGLWWEDLVDLDPGQTDDFDVAVNYWKHKPDQSKVSGHSLQIFAEYGFSSTRVGTPQREERANKLEALRRALEADLKEEQALSR